MLVTVAISMLTAVRCARSLCVVFESSSKPPGQPDSSGSDGRSIRVIAIKTVDSQARFSPEIDVFGRAVHYAQSREPITKS